MGRSSIVALRIEATSRDHCFGTQRCSVKRSIRHSRRTFCSRSGTNALGIEGLAMTTDRKKPGVAFWATVVVVCLPALYVGAYCWMVEPLEIHPSKTKFYCLP